MVDVTPTVGAGVGVGVGVGVVETFSNSNQFMLKRPEPTATVSVCTPAVRVSGASEVAVCQVLKLPVLGTVTVVSAVSLAMVR